MSTLYATWLVSEMVVVVVVVVVGMTACVGDVGVTWVLRLGVFLFFPFHRTNCVKEEEEGRG